MREKKKNFSKEKTEPRKIWYEKFLPQHFVVIIISN